MKTKTSIRSGLTKQDCKDKFCGGGDCRFASNPLQWYYYICCKGKNGIDNPDSINRCKKPDAAVKKLLGLVGI